MEDEFMKGFSCGIRVAAIEIAILAEKSKWIWLPAGNILSEIEKLELFKEMAKYDRENNETNTKGGISEQIIN